MRGFLRVLAAALAAMGRVVWTRCADTGRWLATTVFGSAAAEYFDDGIEEVAEAPPPSLDHIRALAAAVASGSVRPEMLEKVDEDTFAWLSVLDRKMVAKLLMANDTDLRAHMKGQRSIRGVVGADRQSVRDYRSALSRVVQRDAEHEDEPGLVFG